MKRALVLMIVLAIVTSLFAISTYSHRENTMVKFDSSAVVNKGEQVPGSIVVFDANAVIDGENGEVAKGVIASGLSLLNFSHIVKGLCGIRAENDRITWGFRFSPFASIMFGLLNFIAAVALAVLVVVLLPEQTSILADMVEREPLKSLGVGFLATILIPFVFLSLIIIILVGWLLIPLVAIAIPVVYFYGYVGVARWLGKRIIEVSKAAYKSPVAQVLIGALIIGIIAIIPVLGWLVQVVAALFGLGAVILSRFGTGKPWSGKGQLKSTPPEAGAA